MKKEDIYNSFDSIVPNDEQKSKMLNKILNQNKEIITSKPNGGKRKKIVIVAAMICLMTTTVIATNIPSFLNLLEKISPDMVEFIEPVEEVCIDQGIKMEVVAVGRYDNMVKAYITVQDLIGNRVGKDISFLDYYNIKGANSCGWSIIDYDEQNKKVTILMEAENDTKFEGENLTFKIDNIFYGRKEYKDYGIKVDLGQLKSAGTPYVNATIKQFLSWSQGKLYSNILDGDIIPILKPHVTDIKFPEIKTSMISNIGIIDGKLHVQVWRDKNFEGQGVNIYIKDSDGEKLYSDSHFSFGIDKSSNPTNDTDYPSYSEYIFDVNTDKLDEYELFGDFNTSNQLEGNWQVTFKAEDSGKTLEKDCDVDLGSAWIKKITINPFGINLTGIAPNGVKLSDLDIKINQEDDLTETSHHSIKWDGTRWENDNFFLIYKIEKPIDLDSITSITINGEEVIIKE